MSLLEYRNQLKKVLQGGIDSHVGNSTGGVTLEIRNWPFGRPGISMY